jgi:DNA processing protein
MGHIDKAVDNSPGNRAKELLALADDQLARALAPSDWSDFIDRAEGRDPVMLREAIAGAAAWATCPHDSFYPEALRDLGDPPATLFGRGDPRLLESIDPSTTVTIVGSRRPSRQGRDLAAELGRQVASAGLPVVSGMAMGIDSAAHRGALEAMGLTVAVLGCGVDVPYPPRSSRLYDEIVERGLVLGELPPGTKARRWTFPARNRIMAALGRMTVVVEARERSGSLITADLAGQLSREVGAVPGRVGSSPAAGTNALLHDGAHVIRGAQDVLDALIGPGAAEDIATPRGPTLEDELADVLDLVERGSSSADAIARASGLAPGPLAAALVQLELSGYLRSDSSGRYERTSLRAPEPA